jgi:MoaA/NifB/PqqE/SkfB family radical SAM enzyme
MIFNTQKARIVREHFGRYRAKQREKRHNGGHFPLEDVFLYVTSRCNATCDHCFYWKELNRPEDEIQIPEFEKLAESIPPFEFLVMTGGEPFLRKDVDEIVGAFAKRDKCHTFQFNTNGFTPKLIEKRVRDICERFPDRRFQVMCSLDGYQETHNKIRNNPRAWELTNETIGRLTPLMRNEFRNQLYIGVLSVVCDLNWQQIEPLAQHVRQEYGVIHAFEMIRGTDFSVWNLDDDVRDNYNPPGMALPPSRRVG